MATATSDDVRMNKKSKATDKKVALPLKKTRGRRPQSMGLKAAKDALYREHILEAAEHIFAEQGFASARMNDIAKAVGISLGTLYQAYPGKTELYRAILIARDNEMLKTVMTKGHKVLQQPQSIEQLLWLMNTHLTYLLDHPDYLRMQLQQGHAWYHVTARPSEDEQKIWERGLATMKQVFIWGESQGHFIAGDAIDQARLMLALQQTRLANWVSAGMREAHAIVMARVQADFVRYFCRPAIAEKFLSKDGASLSSDAQKRILSVGQTTTA